MFQRLARPVVALLVAATGGLALASTAHADSVSPGLKTVRQASSGLLLSAKPVSQAYVTTRSPGTAGYSQAWRFKPQPYGRYSMHLAADERLCIVPDTWHQPQLRWCSTAGGATWLYVETESNGTRSIREVPYGGALESVGLGYMMQFNWLHTGPAEPMRQWSLTTLPPEPPGDDPFPPVCETKPSLPQCN